MSTLNKAIQLAAEAHEGQFDKAGQPYILHPLRVMMFLETEEEKIVGVLHDVIEDTTITEERLRQLGFSEKIIEAVRSVARANISKQRKENYWEFIRRA
jgi:guanosine-3',5'-bis(diphosphate) 3'-pyrophosphohydrolase